MLLQITVSPFSLHPNKQQSLTGDTRATGLFLLVAKKNE